MRYIFPNLMVGGGKCFLRFGRLNRALTEYPDLFPKRTYYSINCIKQLISLLVTRLPVFRKVRFPEFSLRVISIRKKTYYIK